jgi:hypothetical protein
MATQQALSCITLVPGTSRGQAKLCPQSFLSYHCLSPPSGVVIMYVCPTIAVQHLLVCSMLLLKQTLNQLLSIRGLLEQDFSLISKFNMPSPGALAK